MLGEETIRDLYELSLVTTVSGLDSEGRVTVQRAGGLHSDLSVLVNTLARLGVLHTAPAGGDEDGDGVDVSPASAGGVEHTASLPTITIKRCKVLQINPDHLVAKKQQEPIDIMKCQLFSYKIYAYVSTLSTNLSDPGLDILYDLLAIALYKRNKISGNSGIKS